MRKREATTVGRKKFDELLSQLEETQQELSSARELARKRGEERAAALTRADEQEKAAALWQERARAAEERAARAEGYASALLDQQRPARPQLPWEKPQTDQYGNPINGYRGY